MMVLIGSLMASWSIGFLLGWNTKMIRMAVNVA